MGSEIAFYVDGECVRRGEAVALSPAVPERLAAVLAEAQRCLMADAPHGAAVLTRRALDMVREDGRTWRPAARARLVHVHDGKSPLVRTSEDLVDEVIDTMRRVGDHGAHDRAPKLPQWKDEITAWWLTGDASGPGEVSHNLALWAWTRALEAVGWAYR